MPKSENATPRGNLEKSRGELNEGRPHPTLDIPAGEYLTENGDPHEQKGAFSDAPLQPLSPYSRDKESGENPEVDDVTHGHEAQQQPEKRERMDKAEGSI